MFMWISRAQREYWEKRIKMQDDKIEAIERCLGSEMRAVRRPVEGVTDRISVEPYISFEYKHLIYPIKTILMELIKSLGYEYKEVGLNPYRFEINKRKSKLNRKEA